MRAIPIERKTDRMVEKQAGRETDEQADRPTKRQRNRKKGNQTGRGYRDKARKQMDGQINRQINMLRDR